MFQKNNETVLLFIKVLIFSKSLGQLHTDGEIVPTAKQEIFNRYCPQHEGYTLFDISKVSKWRPLGTFFNFEKGKNRRTDVKWIGALENHRNAFWCQKFCYGEGSVTQGVVITEHQFVYNVWSPANHPFSESFKNIFIENLVKSLSWRSKFFVDD